MKLILAAASLAPLLTSAQGPGDGVSKTTYSSTQPFVGGSFNLKYFPVTPAADSCPGGSCKPSGSHGEGPTRQGRTQLTLAGYFAKGARNCQLFSKIGSSSASSGATSMTWAGAADKPTDATWGLNCAYSASHAYAPATATVMWSTFAHDADQCCKACAAAGALGVPCVGATYTAAAPDAEVLAARQVNQPTPSEGFGLHLVDVYDSKTTGGLNVSVLEQHYSDHMGALAAGRVDPWLDYSVALFTADLDTYGATFKADNVSTLTASWDATTSTGKATWYSLFVHVPASQMIIELVGPKNPGTEVPVKMEPRVSKRNVARFEAATGSAGILSAVSVNRAVSNMSQIEFFYTTVLGTTLIDTFSSATVERRCYEWKGAKSDTCFTQRTGAAATSMFSDFTVKNFEEMMWSAHAAMLSSPAISTDKYCDNHYAVDLQISAASIVSYVNAHQSAAYPITTAPPSPTFWSYNCMQNYAIDPTGWSIQLDLSFATEFTGCADAKE